jgi:hypothetical protein
MLSAKSPVDKAGQKTFCYLNVVKSTTTSGEVRHGFLGQNPVNGWVKIRYSCPFIDDASGWEDLSWVIAGNVC